MVHALSFRVAYWLGIENGFRCGRRARKRSISSTTTKGPSKMLDKFRQNARHGRNCQRVSDCMEQYYSMCNN